RHPLIDAALVGPLRRDRLQDVALGEDADQPIVLENDDCSYGAGDHTGCRPGKPRVAFNRKNVLGHDVCQDVHGPMLLPRFPHGTGLVEAAVRTAMSVASSNMIAVAFIAVMAFGLSFVGIRQTTSPPTTSHPRRPCRIPVACVIV